MSRLDNLSPHRELPHGMHSMSEQGARYLAARIEEHWRKLGYPQVKAEAIFAQQDGVHGWIVKSNLVNGMPPKVAVPAKHKDVRP